MLSFDLKTVEQIESGRIYVHQDFVRCKFGRRHRPFCQCRCELLQRRVLFDYEGAHYGSSERGLRTTVEKEGEGL